LFGNDFGHAYRTNKMRKMTN